MGRRAAATVAKAAATVAKAAARAVAVTAAAREGLRQPLFPLVRFENRGGKSHF